MIQKPYETETGEVWAVDSGRYVNTTGVAHLGLGVPHASRDMRVSLLKKSLLSLRALAHSSACWLVREKNCWLNTAHILLRLKKLFGACTVAAGAVLLGRVVCPGCVSGVGVIARQA